MNKILSPNRVTEQYSHRKYYVSHANEVCERDLDGDDLVIAVCGAKSMSRASTYTTRSWEGQKADAQRIVDLLNAAHALPTTGKS